MGTEPEGFAAATPGTALMEGVWLLSATLGSGPGANDDCVATEEHDIERAGLAGRAGANGAGDAGNVVPVCEGCLAMGTVACVGVGVGVDWFEVAAAMLMEVGCWCLAGPGCTCPSSPGWNVRHEQNPSEEVMRSVWPSFVHVRSVKVAKCRLLTIHSGFCCCVS